MKSGIPPVLSRCDSQAARALHQKLVTFARNQAQDRLTLGSMLVEAQSQKLHRLAGYATFYEYVERLLGYSRRETEGRSRRELATGGE